MHDLGGLSPMHFGFRRGKGIIDAIGEVINMATRVKEYCVLITLDVRNAFNTGSGSKF